MRLLALILLSVIGSPLLAGTPTVLRSAAELNRAQSLGLGAGIPFSFEAKVTFPSQELHPMTTVQDRTASST